MNILIPTRIRDTHALAVDRVLTARGHNVVRWFPADLPSRQWITFDLNAKNYERVSIFGTGIDIDSIKFDVVWLRRPSPPFLPDVLHPGDQIFAEEECSHFYRSIWDAIAPDATWVNSYHAQMISENKIVQLRTAYDCGFRVPDGIISNNPYEIEKFIDYNKNERVIYKCFRQHKWELPENGEARLHTSIVNFSDLPDTEILQMTPGIFQKYIKKKYEVRSNYFDDYNISVKIDTSKFQGEAIDWRLLSIEDRNIVQISMPYDINKKCIEFMKKLGIRFGCFDFIVTEDDEYVFLEVNEMCQFLWIEMANPETKMLSVFSKFLENVKRSSKFRPKSDDIKFKDYYVDIKFQNQTDLEEKIHFFKDKELPSDIII